MLRICGLVRFALLVVCLPEGAMAAFLEQEEIVLSSDRPIVVELGTIHPGSKTHFSISIRNDSGKPCSMRPITETI
jgi:hypothetical protein